MNTEHNIVFNLFNRNRRFFKIHNSSFLSLSLPQSSDDPNNPIIYLYIFVKGYPSAVNWATPRVSNPEPEPVNMHRKLQRQLTLNPACDPRLYQLRRYHQQQTGQSPQQQSVINSPRTSMQHRPLTRLASNESSYPVTAIR